MALRWSINRRRRDATGEGKRGTLGPARSWPRRVLYGGLSISRPAAKWNRTPAAVCLLAVMVLLAALLAWATVSLAGRAIASSEAAAGRSGGSLVIPAPQIAANLPRRIGAVGEPGAAPIVAVLRHRFGAVGAALLGAAQRAAGGAARGTPPRSATTAWTSGLYGEPGHIDPLTGRPAWVMYLGLEAGGPLGPRPDVIGHLMVGILGPYSKIGPWPVAAGQRGGAADCTVAWLVQTKMAVCGWTSGHAIGALASPTRDMSVPELATLMARMRFDLQQP